MKRSSKYPLPTRSPHHVVRNITRLHTPHVLFGFVLWRDVQALRTRVLTAFPLYSCTSDGSNGPFSGSRSAEYVCDANALLGSYATDWDAVPALCRCGHLRVPRYASTSGKRRSAAGL